jgi:hypothetical protein
MRRLLWILSLIMAFSAAVPIMAADLTLTGNLNGNYYYAKGNIVSQGTCTVQSGANVKCSTFGEVTLNPGFETMAGSTFYADINNQDDTDADGLPDWWEYFFFHDLSSQGANGDPDRDRVTNLQEYILRTDPTVDTSDSDADNLPDWWEIQYFGNLNQNAQGDYDNDGISNELEYLTGTNPADPNSKPKPGTYYLYDSMGRVKKITKVIPQ